jgi:hypothetical protein
LMFYCHGCRRLIRSIHEIDGREPDSKNKDVHPTHFWSWACVAGYWNVATTYCTTAPISSVVNFEPNSGMSVPPLVMRPTRGDASSGKNRPIPLIDGALPVPAPFDPWQSAQVVPKTMAPSALTGSVPISEEGVASSAGASSSEPASSSKPGSSPGAVSATSPSVSAPSSFESAIGVWVGSGIGIAGTAVAAGGSGVGVTGAAVGSGVAVGGTGVAAHAM